MARIPESEIERIKRETDLAALVRSRGVELARHGARDLAGKCPFHADERPSFIVSPAKGLFHCMGCGAAGNAIQFVEKFDGVSFRHAFELLNEGRAAFTAPPEGRIKQSTVRRLEAPVRPDAEEAELFAQVVEYYHERLLGAPAALDYLKGRGLCHAEAMERFRLGFADRTLGLRLPEKNRKPGAAIRTRLRKLGLLRESGHEHFSGSIVLPIYEYTGHARPADGGAAGHARRVAGMYGRKIGSNLRRGTPLHLYLPGPHAGIWNPEALDAGEVILCEAPLDALTFWVNGFHNATFIFGTEGFPEYLFEAILERKARRVRLAYDADDAGNRAASRDAERLAAHGVECFRVKFPWGMDANEYACKAVPADKSLAAVLNAAEWMDTPVKCRVSGVECRGDGVAQPGSAGAGSSEIVATNLLAAEYVPPEADPPLAEAADETDGGLLSATLDTRHASPDTPRALDRQGEYLALRLGRREYRVGGLEKNNSLEALKVSVRLMARMPQNPSQPGTAADDVRFHLDSFDMTRDAERRRFIERAAEETGLERELIKRDLGALLLALESAQQERIASVLSPAPRAAARGLSGAERAEALELLESPDLLGKIGAAFEACGLAGEETNRLAAYLACTSRKLEKPLAVIVQSASAAGKSMLMESALAMFPEEERVKYSAMTGQSLYYLGEQDLKHKILAIIEEEGAQKAGYALKLLQSEGELTIASTGKDPRTGRMETQEYRVEGPVTIFLTTTAVELDEELLNRCLILAVDESREQTERIHALQRRARTLDGLAGREEKRGLLRVLRNAQRLLQPLAVVNPFAGELTFTAERTRARRDHEKYLTLIDTLALLHQRQRRKEKLPLKGAPPAAAAAAADGGQSPGVEEARGEYITATLEDVALANRLAPELLGRGLDELPPQTRRVYEAIKDMVRERCEAEKLEQRFALFSRREIRSRLGWGLTQVRAHLERLRELEYIAARCGRAGATYQYELLTDCRETEEKAHIGLLDVEKLRVSAKLPSEDARLRQPTPPSAGQACREKQEPVGGCRNVPRQVQPIEEPRLTVNLSACRERASGAPLLPPHRRCSTP